MQLQTIFKFTVILPLVLLLATPSIGATIAGAGASLPNHLFEAWFAIQSARIKHSRI